MLWRSKVNFLQRESIRQARGLSETRTTTPEEEEGSSRLTMCLQKLPAGRNSIFDAMAGSLCTRTETQVLFMVLYILKDDKTQQKHVNAPTDRWNDSGLTPPTHQ